ncbi:MAG TPA: hypothetical protein VF698_10320 [Thermoanaerobaculia bacterium]
MTMKTAITALLVLLLAPFAFAQQGRPGLRQHLSVTTASGKVYRMSELMSGPDAAVSRTITLFEGDGGQRYIFILTDDLPHRRTTVEFKHLNSQAFLRGSFVLPFEGNSVAELKAARDALGPDAYVVPLTIESKAFGVTERMDQWRGPDAASSRAALVRHLQGNDVTKALGAARLAVTSGSPAARTFCGLIETIVAPGQSCRRDRAVTVTPLDDGCAFDAQFGYPCTQ